MSINSGKILNGRCREIIFNVVNYFTNEEVKTKPLLKKILIILSTSLPASEVSIPRDTFLEIVEVLKTNSKIFNRAVTATGVSKSIVTSVRKEGKISKDSFKKFKTPKRGKRKAQIVLDNYEKCAIRNIISNMYRQSIAPTVRRILARAKIDINFRGQKTTLTKCLKKQLGYRFQKSIRKNSYVLIEIPRIAVQRARYLRKIRENDDLADSKKLVVYLGTTWLHSNGSEHQSQSSSDRKSLSEHSRWIMIHAGSENGFVSGAQAVWKAESKGECHDQINEETFEKWVTDHLLPNIPSNSIIVINNSFCNGEVLTKAPISTSRKDTIIAWLVKNNIEFSPHLTRPELYELVRRNLLPQEYVIDHLIKKHGFEVLRLPLHNYDLNPIEYIWHLVNERLGQKEVLEKDNEVDLALESLATITEDDWQQQVHHVKQLENEYWLRDNSDFPLNEVAVNSDCDSSDDDTDESSDEYMSDT
ncbi:uncharacterized protein [Choristoneura fumiferana]|uniref:uncharacterized protein n=1 Tax=Choristoneura fumiferana TaxID=7141 RepID=UPI003D156362